MKYERCKKCGEFGWEAHKCFRFDVRIVPEKRMPDEWADAWEIWAKTDKAAAKAFADQWDQDDREMMRGVSIVVEVQNMEGQVSRWVVWGEAVPTYYADFQPNVPAPFPSPPVKEM